MPKKNSKTCVGHTAWAHEGPEGPKGLQLEVGAQRAPRLLVLIYFLYIISLLYNIYYQSCRNYDLHINFNFWTWTIDMVMVFSKQYAVSALFFLLFTFCHSCQQRIVLHRRRKIFFFSSKFVVLAQGLCWNWMPCPSFPLGGGGVPRPPNSATAPGPSNNVRSLPGNLVILILSGAKKMLNIFFAPAPNYLIDIHLEWASLFFYEMQQ